MTEETFERPWIEKYRPEFLSDVVGNSDVVEQLREIAQQGNIPHMILVGPPGTGKTTSVMALARELLGENFKKATFELNASDDRGIDTVRDKIKSFAAQKIVLGDGRHKIIILDEADSMTESAQQALRIIISDYSNTTRFALACNDSNKIIEPIQSRCVILRYSKLSNSEIRERLMKIISHENLNYEEGGIEALIETSDGDMRYALNNLQSTCVGFGLISRDNVYKIVDVPKPEAVKIILNDCFSQKLDSAISGIDELLVEGYTNFDLINVMSKIVQEGDLNEDMRMECLKEISIGKVRALEGYDSSIQLYGLIASLCEIAGGFKK